MEMKFAKMHGASNDFMVARWPDGKDLPDVGTVRRWANRRDGVGFDQLLLVRDSQHPDSEAFYHVFNADGIEVQQCGNGVRCIARYLLPDGTGDTLLLEGQGGTVEVRLGLDDEVSVNLGEPNFAPAALPFRPHKGVCDEYLPLCAGTSTDAKNLTRYRLGVDSGAVEFGVVSLGNPHAVIPVDSVDTAPVGIIGPQLQSHPSFPEGVNVGFVEFRDAANIRLRVFERGTGETEDCQGEAGTVLFHVDGGKHDIEGARLKQALHRKSCHLRRHVVDVRLKHPNLFARGVHLFRGADQDAQYIGTPSEFARPGAIAAGGDTHGGRGTEFLAETDRERRAGRRGQFRPRAFGIGRNAFQQPRRGRCGNGHDTVGDPHRAAADVDRRARDPVNAERTQSGARADDVRDGIPGADFVKMDSLHRYAVNCRFNLAQAAEHAQAVMLYLVVQRRLSDDSFNRRERTVGVIVLGFHLDLGRRQTAALHGFRADRQAARYRASRLRSARCPDQAPRRPMHREAYRRQCLRNSPNSRLSRGLRDRDDESGLATHASTIAPISCHLKGCRVEGISAAAQVPSGRPNPELG